MACASALSSASPLRLDRAPVLLAELRNPLLRLLPRVGRGPALFGLRGVLVAECGRAEELDLFLRGELDALAVCIHQFLHCLDGVLQPLGLLQQQPVLPSQVPEDIGARVIEQGSDVVERHPDGPVHQHQVQSLDVGVGVFAVARRGADARTTRPMWS
jgi:hypothetical protein